MLNELTQKVSFILDADTSLRTFENSRPGGQHLRLVLNYKPDILQCD